MTLDQSTRPLRSVPGLTLDLTDDERSALRELVEQLVATAPALLDDLSWVAQARQASCRLPVRLMQTLRAYRAQQWDQVEVNLINLQRMNPECGVYKLFAERVAGFRRTPPPANWDGAWTFDEK